MGPLNLSTIFFDLDGTLADNYDAITMGVGEALEAFNFKRPTRNEIKRIVGGSIGFTMEKLVGKDLAKEAAEHYLKVINNYNFLGLKKMPYSAEILDALNQKNLRTVCLTNKTQKSAEEVLRKLGLAEKLYAIIGTALEGPHKPDRKFTEAAVQKVGAKPEESMIIGDSVYDYRCAENFGIACLLVATGGNAQEELKELCPNALGVYKDLEELYLKFFNN